jgi:menaquinone-dependent protoporphyrinogen IX oxidase
MRIVVAYDTYYGNTKQVAETIAEQAKAEGHEVELRNVKEGYPTPPQGEALFVGSPVRVGKVTRATRRFVKRLDPTAWRNKPIIVFTTTAKAPADDATEKQKRVAQKWAFDVAPKFKDKIKAHGLNALDTILFVEVKDVKGPLVDTGVEKAKQFAHEILQKIRK